MNKRFFVHQRLCHIPFWVDFGTLLGLVRDGCLIPWDDDYDFGVWKHEVSKEMVHQVFGNPEFFIKPSASHNP
jgi:phosphorylcholine metabolism protein LicD